MHFGDHLSMHCLSLYAYVHLFFFFFINLFYQWQGETIVNTPCEELFFFKICLLSVKKFSCFICDLKQQSF